jgi:ADP-ribosyl-[dinitrogen reductase] hydrolase
VYGIAGIPMRWTSAVHGRLPGFGDRVWQLADLHHLAAALEGSTAPRYEAPETRRLEPREVADGVWAADLDGARSSSPDFAVVSLCRTGSRFPHEVQRFAYLTDDDANSELDAVLADVLDDIAALRADGRPVLVHCFAGQSRTGLVLRAWLRRTRGMSATEATEYVRQRWPHLSEWNADFTAALQRVR